MWPLLMDVFAWKPTCFSDSAGAHESFLLFSQPLWKDLSRLNISKDIFYLDLKFFITFIYWAILKSWIASYTLESLKISKENFFSTFTRKKIETFLIETIDTLRVWKKEKNITFLCKKIHSIGRVESECYIMQTKP